MRRKKPLWDEIDITWGPLKGASIAKVPSNPKWAWLTKDGKNLLFGKKLPTILIWWMGDKKTRDIGPTK